jgi:hypothetical protein
MKRPSRAAYRHHRQASPAAFDKKSFRIITLSQKKGVRAVVGCPRGHFHAGRCDIGTRVQSILVRKKK